MRFADQPGPGLLRGLLQILDLLLHSLDRQILLAHVELMLLGGLLPRLRGDPLALLIETARDLQVERLPLLVKLALLPEEFKLPGAGLLQLFVLRLGALTQIGKLGRDLLRGLAR